VGEKSHQPRRNQADSEALQSNWGGKKSRSTLPVLNPGDKKALQLIKSAPSRERGDYDSLNLSMKGKIGDPGKLAKPTSERQLSGRGHYIPDEEVALHVLSRRERGVHYYESWSREEKGSGSLGS